MLDPMQGPLVTIVAFLSVVQLSVSLAGTCNYDAQLCASADKPWREVADLASQWTPEPSKKGHVHIVMQVTEPIGQYSRFAIANAALWGRTHGFTLSVHGELSGGNASHPTPPNMDHRFGKVKFMRDHAQSCPAEWLLWLDADVSIAVDRDWTREIIDEYPQAKVIGSHEAGGDGVINSGILLVKCEDPWAKQFLDNWWTHPNAATGATDQFVMAKLIAADETNSFKVLPIHIMNSDPFWWNSFAPNESPVIHLMVSLLSSALPPPTLP